ncbi:hypothetical protein PR202_ga30384 [Eleusine coracana subsp. coracana]|uniref:Uncharacterized protein n=1 Tax=Eleusine coracana subsp. coracana TaxID=191504 RepID=A0AAV5DPT6_ELECO|nr:hypothetical protein PR202_ga30384 [Eleusine coracana subsp. coracana]
MESPGKFFPVVAILLLLVVATDLAVPVQARSCVMESEKFKGLCISSDNCGNTLVRHTVFLLCHHVSSSLVEDPPRGGVPCRTCRHLDLHVQIENVDPEFAWVRRRPASEWDPIDGPELHVRHDLRTSAPKGVVHSHRDILVTMDFLIDPRRPMFLWSYPWGMAVVGGTNVCLLRVDAGSVYASIVRHKVDHVCGVPLVFKMLANYAAPEAALPG